MLQWDAGWVAVLDGDHFLGVLTPSTLHEALRRSVSADEEGIADSTRSSLPVIGSAALRAHTSPEAADARALR